MESLNLKQAVTQAVEQSWGEFARAHPALASILDRELLIEEAQKQIEREPAYQLALAKAAACEAGSDLLADVALPVVQRLIGRLLL
jgi:hypothetical protein